MDRQRYMKDYRTAYKARAKIVKVALSNDLHAILAARAKSEGLTPTTLVRELVASGLAGDPRVPAAVAHELRTLERLVRSIANNLNQLAHHANAVRRVVDVQSIFQELKRLDAAVRAYTLKRLT
jgi:hypothetical protein